MPGDATAAGASYDMGLLQFDGSYAISLIPRSKVGIGSLSAPFRKSW